MLAPTLGVPATPDYSSVTDTSIVEAGVIDRPNSNYPYYKTAPITEFFLDILV